MLERDQHACQWPDPDAPECLAHATHVDHIEPGSSGSVPDDDLWALCEPHHQTKTSSEGGRANAARYDALRRPQRRHPGLLW